MQSTLLAAQIGRRKLGIAIFRGTHLEHTETKQLSSDAETATRSVLGVVNRLAEHFEIDSVVLEQLNGEVTTRAEQCRAELATAMRERGIPVLQIERTQLCSCVLPPCKTRYQLRRIALSVWPVLDEFQKEKLVCDAALLGLFVQVERLLSVIPT